MKNLVGKITIFLLLILLGGCSATGEKFVAPALINEDTATVYLMRQDKFLGAAGCRDVLINKVDFGCIKNAGFLKIEISPGNKTITLPKVTENDWANETSVEQNFERGGIYYYEWTHELEDFYVIPAGSIVVTGGKTKASIIKHSKASALPILKELRDSN